MRENSPCTPVGPQLTILEKEHEKSGGGTGSPSFRHYFERARHLLETIQGEAAVVPWILVERVAEGRDDVGEPAWRQHSLDLPHYLVRTLYVFQHGVALHALKQTAGKRKLLGIGHHIHARQGKQVQ